MPSTLEFEELYGVTEERALNFWVSNLQETMGAGRWFQIRNSTGVYLASVLANFCLTSFDRKMVLSSDYSPSAEEFRQFADLTQIAEMMLEQLTTAKSPLWMESAGAHILLYAGFFYSQNKERHNIDFFSKIGRSCYYMAAVGHRERTMKLMAKGFDEYLFLLANLQKNMNEKRYLIKS
jgi:hypothetical protein